MAWQPCPIAAGSPRAATEPVNGFDHRAEDEQRTAQGDRLVGDERGNDRQRAQRRRDRRESGLVVVRHWNLLSRLGSTEIAARPPTSARAIFPLGMVFHLLDLGPIDRSASQDEIVRGVGRKQT